MINKITTYTTKINIIQMDQEEEDKIMLLPTPTKNVWLRGTRVCSKIESRHKTLKSIPIRKNRTKKVIHLLKRPAPTKKTRARKTNIYTNIEKNNTKSYQHLHKNTSVTQGDLHRQVKPTSCNHEDHGQED